MNEDAEGYSSQEMPMSTQTWNPETYVRDAGFVAKLGEPLLDVLVPRAGERVLDLGCGDGALTRKLVEAGCRVVGVDASPAQVEAARARGLDAHVIDAAALPYDAEFDAVLSNATLHWVADLRATLAGVQRALVPGGRFVVECGGEGNLHAIRGALWDALTRRGVDPAPLDPWHFRSAEAYGEALVEAGFSVGQLSAFARPTPVPAGIEAWLAVFARSFLAAVPEAEHAALMREVADALAPALRAADGSWTADYVRVRFSAQRA
jgi:SAM-dependent methyltransferase